MTNIYEVDWRYALTKEVFEGLSVSLEKIKNEVAPFDLDHAMDLLENFLGVAFVSAQIYISGTVADVNKIVKSPVKLKKDDLLKNFSNQVLGTGVTEVQIFDAVANYYKHHDEWPDWSPSQGEVRKKTIDLLNTVGITEDDFYPCYEAANMLWLTIPPTNLSPLLHKISDWRRDVIAAHK